VDMMKQMVLSMLPPEMKAEIERAMTELQKTGKTESVTQVPGVGNCRITIVKLEE
jgi:hypothetical protein